jgi:site-specific DNA-methyltransferase (cytosine-N4-specific)
MTLQNTLSSAALKARRRRIDRGVTTESAARKMTPKTSLQGLMQLPLLEALEECGGRSRPGQIYERLADRLGLSEEVLAETRTCADGQNYRVFQQQVRWARQTAVMQGLIAKGERGIWELADPAYAQLQKARRGVTVLIYSLDNGLALWGHAEDVASTIEKGSIQLILTSPPYPVIERQYGRFTVPEWLAWMRDLTGMWKDLLAEDGTLAVNLMDVFVSGTPALSPYIERFTLSAIDTHGLHLAGRHFWHSPTKLGNIHWAVKERVRPRNSIEHILLFSKSPHPNWDTRRLPKLSYRESTIARRDEDARRARSKRPSGYTIDPHAFALTENGPIPGNLIVAGGASGGDRYSKRCREAGIQAHPARYPEALPRQIIALTTEPGQICYDPMAGSNTTGKVALEMGRRFIASEVMLSYIESSAFRFDDRPDFVRHPLLPHTTNDNTSPEF